jgi:hypothetical protein
MAVGGGDRIDRKATLRVGFSGRRWGGFCYTITHSVTAATI